MRKFILDLAGHLERQTRRRPQDRRGQHNGEAQHAGLLLQRYLCENATGDEGNPEEKRAILLAAIKAANNVEVQTLYQIAFNRWSELLSKESTPVNLVNLATQGRLIVGLGSENVLETGIRLHHTYGMPIIPGSALKGLAAHYCDSVWGERHIGTPSAEAHQFRGERREDKQRNQKAELAGEYHQLLFGSTDESGCIIFHDAWLTPDSPEPLVLDVMTPHHPKWNDIQNPIAPSDFDSPIPIPFLSVKGTFCFAVSWHGPISDKSKNWTELALSLLCDALCDWGVGGKTSSGYGRFDRAKFEEAKRGLEAKQEKLRLEAEAQAKLAAMSPIERNIGEFLTAHPNKGWPDYMKLLDELKKPAGQWTSEDDRREIAKRVKQGMIDAKKWGKKDKDAERTEFIKKTLGE